MTNLHKTTATANDLLICKKIVESGEISNIKKFGNDLKEMNIGVKSIVTKQYCNKPIPKNHPKEISLILLHAGIIFFTILNIADFTIPSHDDNLIWYEHFFSQHNLLVANLPSESAPFKLSVSLSNVSNLESIKSYKLMVSSN